MARSLPIQPHPSFLFLLVFAIPSSNKIVNKVAEIEEGKTEAEKRAERQKAAELEAEKKKKAAEEEEKKKKEKAEQGKGKKKKQED